MLLDLVDVGGSHASVAFAIPPQWQRLNWLRGWNITSLLTGVLNRNSVGLAVVLSYPGHMPISCWIHQCDA